LSAAPSPELLAVMDNLARFHREHEQFYSQAPLRQAIELEATSRALKALATHWSTAAPAEHPAPVPFAGAEDLNPPGLVGSSGILFMEQDQEPAELAQLRRGAEQIAADCESTGAWLEQTMQQSWDAAGGLVQFAELADLIGERHRIVSNDWHAAELSRMAGRAIRRALDVLAAVDFAPPSVREDLAGPRRYPALLLSASELLDHAADLFAESATLVHENERRWRVFGARIRELR
jgi:hypothetical protein